MTGSIPPELGNLRNLEFLQLSRTEVTGAFLREIGNLASLTSLHVMGTELTGPLPEALIGLPLDEFHWMWTDLCAPADDAFQNWLKSIRDNRPAGNCGS